MANYYVSKIGNDSSPGSLASPFLTIQKGVNTARNPGDTVYVRGGTYNEVVTMNYAGTSGNYITLKNYNGESVTLDGGWNIPSGNLALPTSACLANTPDAASTSFDGLLNVRAAYVWVEGIRVYRSRGRGIRVIAPTNTALRTHHVTVKNCETEKSNNVGILVEGLIGTVDSDPRVHTVTIDGCTVWHSGYYIPRQHSAVPCNWPGALTLKATTDVTIKNCTIHTNYGEGILSDANNGGTKNVTVQDCVFYDGMAGYISFHAVRNATVERSAFYYTGKSSGLDGTDGVVIAPGERHLNNEGKVARREYWGKDCLVRNCLFVGCYYGVALKRGNSGTSAELDPAMGDVWIYNNTFIRCTTAIYSNQNLRQAGTKTYVKNNVCYNNTTDSYAISAALWAIDADYNHWSSTPALAAFQGANDVTGNPSLVNSSYAPTRGDFRAENLRLGAGSTAIDQGVDLSATFTDDYWGVTRAGTWDMGAHEYDGVSYPTPTATASASTTTPDVGDTVTFTGAASGGTAPYTYSWTFGDGNTSTTQNPTHSYASDGSYIVTLRVEDANNLVDTDTVTINVFAEPQSGGGSTAPADVEMVTFSAAATYFATSRTPSWMMFFVTGGISDDTADANAVMGIGIHDVANTQSYCLAWSVQDDVGTTNVAQQMHNDKAIVLSALNGADAGSATITSVTANTVSLSWSGTTAGERVVALCGAGTAFQDVLATTFDMTANGTERTVSGDYTHIFFPTSFRDDANSGIVDISFGVGIRGGDQMCVAWHSRDAQASSSTAAAIFTDRIAHRPFFGDRITISSWDNTSIGLTPVGRDLNASLPALLIKMDTSKTSLYMDTVDVATSTGTGTYALGFDPALAFAVTTTLDEVNPSTVPTDSSTGAFGFAFVDDGGTDRTLQIYDKDGASPTVAKSYTDDNFTIKDYAGTTQATGTMSISGNNLLINLGTAPSTAYKMLLMAFQEGATAASGPTSAFSHDATSTTTYDDVITVQDLSTGDGTNALSSWTLHWGDTTATATGLTPGGTATHTYAGPGNYTLTHTVIDAAANEDSSTKEISISTPSANVSFTATPVTGTAPLTVTLDASASDAGGDETWALFEWSVHNIESSSDVGFGADEEGIYNFYLTGTTATVSLPSPAEWTIGCTGYTTKYDFDNNTPSTAWSYMETRVSVVREDFTLDFRNTDGEVHVYGTYAAAFTAYLNADTDNTEFEWNLGDGTTTGTYGLATLTHTYSAVNTATNYTVVVTATLPDGDTVLTATRANYINLYPAPGAPLSIEELYNDLVEVKKHLGILYDATWTLESGNAYKCIIDNVHWADGHSTFVLKENGAALTAAADITACSNTPGSYFINKGFASSLGWLLIYVHPTGSGNPATNGKYYRWIAS